MQICLNSALLENKMTTHELCVKYNFVAPLTILTCLFKMYVVLQIFWKIVMLDRDENKEAANGGVL